MPTEIEVLAAQARARKEGLRFTDTWYKNDTIYNIRELPADGLVQLMAQLPPAQDGIYEFAKAEMVDPARRITFVLLFQRKRVGLKMQWFLYQVEKHAM